MSDRIGRNRAYLLVYATQVIIFFAVGGVHALWLVVVLFAVVLLDYGGGFGTMPSFAADYFGTKHMGINYGWILTAWGVGGVVGPMFVAAVKDRTGTFSGALPVIAIVLILAMILPIVTHRPGERAGPFYGLSDLDPWVDSPTRLISMCPLVVIITSHCGALGPESLLRIAISRCRPSLSSPHSANCSRSGSSTAFREFLSVRVLRVLLQGPSLDLRIFTSCRVPLPVGALSAGDPVWLLPPDSS